MAAPRATAGASMAFTGAIAGSTGAAGRRRRRTALRGRARAARLALPAGARPLPLREARRGLDRALLAATAGSDHSTPEFLCLGRGARGGPRRHAGARRDVTAARVRALCAGNVRAHPLDMAVVGASL